MQDLHELPKFRDGLSYLYVEHARVDQDAKAIALHTQEDGEHVVTPVPIAALNLLMLGPGTSITHAAIRALAENDCLVLWCGEEGVRLYASGIGGTRSAYRLLRQSELAARDRTRLAVVERMYRKRLGPLPAGLSLQQIRGKEGVRVREAYAATGKATGVPWHGRNYQRDLWQSADPVNRALSAANACLYGLCHAAILAVGYSPAIGFVHTGKQRSFVFDIADLYKAEITIPVAFHVAAAGDHQIARRARMACRDIFRSTQLLKRIVPDMEDCLAIDAPDVRPIEPVEIDFDGDQAAPGKLWDPDGEVQGGVDHGPPQDDSDVPF
ncbi:type I-E CRISPR-associated endonuclease Cas1 [bacterium]|nr:type I-E CRISPR-associated endonuclease Cas1 [bacterium]